MDAGPSLELIEAHHTFPGTYRIKAIGNADDDFVGRVLAAVAEQLASPSEVDHSVRNTRGGRHTAVTLDLTVQSAEQVQAIYARLREVAGLSMLL